MFALGCGALSLLASAFGFGLGVAVCNHSWQQHTAPPRHAVR